MSTKDVLTALKGGAGGQGRGHGGIEGTPIPLDSTDARFSDYLEQIRRRIQAKWGFPCVRSTPMRQCEVHDASLELHFGILKDGSVQFVDLVRSSEFEIYDEYAINAVRLAQPFPPVPASLMATVPPGSTGIPIAARFSYVVDTSLMKLLR
jgi:TonB family protein